MSNYREIRVQVYDGGGVEVTMENYRPVSLHLKAVPTLQAAMTVAAAVSSLFTEIVSETEIR